MSGFQSLVAQATLLLGIAALIGVVIGWSFGALRASRLTTESYERQLRATLRRMSDAEAETVTLRGRIDEYEAALASQEREYESREHLLAALEARLAEAEGTAAEDDVDEHGAARESLRSVDVAAPEDHPVTLDLIEQDSGVADGAEHDVPNADIEDDVDEPEPVVESLDEAGEELASEDAAAELPDQAPADDGEAGDEGEQLVEPVASALQNGEPHIGLEPAPDDLTAIRGIGKVIASALEEHGITTFEQIAAWTDADVDYIESQIELLRGRVRRDDWIGSAAALHEAHHGAPV